MVFSHSKLEWSHQRLPPYYSGVFEALLKVKFRILCCGMGSTHNKQEFAFIFDWGRCLKDGRSQQALHGFLTAFISSDLCSGSWTWGWWLLRIVVVNHSGCESICRKFSVVYGEIHVCASQNKLPLQRKVGNVFRKSTYLWFCNQDEDFSLKSKEEHSWHMTNTC